jgi:hypothetical protein
VKYRLGAVLGSVPPRNVCACRPVQRYGAILRSSRMQYLAARLNLVTSMARPDRNFIRLLAHLTQASGLDSTRGRTCPYKGLEAFTELDAELFFGRQDTTSLLVEKIAVKPLVAVTGPSGSGKSSLVRAGLIPVLRAKDTPWSIVSFRLGASPLISLAAAVVRLMNPLMPPIDQAESVPKVKDLIEQGQLPHLLEQVGNHNVCTLIFIDQFEELYTLCNQPPPTL